MKTGLKSLPTQTPGTGLRPFCGVRFRDLGRCGVAPGWDVRAVSSCAGKRWSTHSMVSFRASVRRSANLLTRPVKSEARANWRGPRYRAMFPLAIQAYCPGLRLSLLGPPRSSLNCSLPGLRRPIPAAGTSSWPALPAKSARSTTKSGKGPTEQCGPHRGVFQLFALFGLERRSDGRKRLGA